MAEKNNENNKEEDDVLKFLKLPWTNFANSHFRWGARSKM